MKNKFFKKTDPQDADAEIIEGKAEKTKTKAKEETAAEVEAGGPLIAAAKKSKMAVVGASSLLITVVIYFLFFKEEEKPKDKLEEVAPIIRPEQVATSEQSPFEIKQATKTSDSLTELAKPKAPEVPTLPDLPAEDISQILLPSEEEKAKDQQQQALPALPVPTQPNQINVQQVNQPPAQAGQQGQQGQQGITDPRYAPIVVLAGQDGSGPTQSIGYENNIVDLNQNPINKLEKSKVNVKTSFVDNRTNVIAQGKLITAVLETAINTEIPGAVRAIVSRDVYGEAGNEVLISRGSRLFGTYSSQIQRGQGRVQINWTRLIRPDGVDLAISSNASDQFGRSGIAGDVNNKYSTVIANSLLTSILAVGGVAAAESLIGNNSSNTTTVNPQQGTTTTTGRASTQAVYNVSKTITDTLTKIINDNLNANPVIRVPQGTKITVIVNADMNIPSLKR